MKDPHGDRVARQRPFGEPGADRRVLLHFVPINFETERLSAVMQAPAYDPRAPRMDERSWT